jgi:hypothetical protein
LEKVIGQTTDFRVAASIEEPALQREIPVRESAGLGPEWKRRQMFSNDLRRSSRTLWAVRFPLGAFGKGSTNHRLLQPPKKKSAKRRTHYDLHSSDYETNRDFLDTHLVVVDSRA